MLEEKEISYIKNKIRSVFFSLIRPRFVNTRGIKIDMNNCPYISEKVRRRLYSNSYETGEANIIEKKLSKGDVVFEIGAGIGFLSTLCSKIVGSSNVYAYEADTRLIQCIKRTYEINNVNPTLKNCVLGKDQGEVEFWIAEDFWGSSQIKRSENSKKIIVKGEDVNEELDRVNPSFLIVDIEGGEGELFRYIDIERFNVKKILIELHPKMIGDKRCSEILQQLLSSNFQINLRESISNVLLFEKD